MSTEKTSDYSLTSRETFVIGQALQIAIKELKEVNTEFREDSNINDMEYLQNMFPFKGIEQKYDLKIIIDLKDDKSIETIKQTIINNGIDCKVKTVKIY